MSSPELAGEVCPRRFGLNYDPPAIILEYLEVKTGKLFHRKVALKRLRASADPARVAEKLRQKNRPLLTEDSGVCFDQIVSLVKKLQDAMSHDGVKASDDAATVKPVLQHAQDNGTLEPMALVRVTFGDGFERGADEPCSSFERLIPDTMELEELKQILARWAGFGSRCDCFELAAPFAVRGSCWRPSFGRRSRPLPDMLVNGSKLREVVHVMMDDAGYAGVDAQNLAVFAVWPTCPSCDDAAAMTFGRDASSLIQFGGPCSLEDSGGRVIYQLGGKAQCGNCWLKQQSSAGSSETLLSR
ncbi:hypothetical protein AK812_SmicGene29649 [Symbiodinium microadriaticum]|uniref:Uncharacterized protein n=1 Tax=Symbiodinium microadriaticum TaxID=2951 RepID=A0A1Q9D1A6_SYMMI|nr:hypothetical protein AK812_SmicGene29649 [Symbiodinium microadriaticum]